MARLFITPKEMNFVSDITKEILKDVNGQVIYLYPISEIKTKAHDVYGEAIHKVFDTPIEIEALVDATYQNPTRINQFGVDKDFQIEVFIQYRDMLDKQIDFSIGDFFSFSDVFYEITEALVMKNIFGQAEHLDGVRLVGRLARDGQFVAMLKGPTDLAYTDETAEQKKFVQQRGFSENSEGPTGDRRVLIDKGVLDLPDDGPREVSEQGAVSDGSFYSSTFNDEKNR